MTHSFRTWGLSEAALGLAPEATTPISPLSQGKGFLRDSPTSPSCPVVLRLFICRVSACSETHFGCAQDHTASSWSQEGLPPCTGSWVSVLKACVIGRLGVSTDPRNLRGSVSRTWALCCPPAELSFLSGSCTQDENVMSQVLLWNNPLNGDSQTEQ